MQVKSKMCDLMHTSGLLGWVKRSDIEVVQISILIGVGYDRSDNQDGRRCRRNEIYIFCGKYTLLMKRTRMRDPGHMGPLVSSPEPLAHCELL